jgi:hypothetical protein
MKKRIGLTVLAALLITAACRKENSSPRVPQPSWQTDQSGKYPVTMSAVVQLPADLAKHMQSSDQLGAFVGEECRGTGTVVALDTTQVFFLLIHGTAAEQSQIQFKYYSAWASRLYETKPFLSFQADGHYGTVDTPGELEFQGAH